MSLKDLIEQLTNLRLHLKTENFLLPFSSLITISQALTLTGTEDK